MSTLLALAMAIATPPWISMILFPRSSVTRRLATSPGWIWLLCALYGLLLIPLLPMVVPVVVDPELDRIVTALGQPAGATLAWVHFLAFDLFVGRAVYLDSLERGLAGWRTSPFLVLVLLVGPVGYLGYVVMRRRSEGSQGWIETRA